MKILSLFDGISAGRLALDRAGIKVDKYYASEIDKYAIQIAKKNYPDTVHIGDVTKVKGKDLPKIDLLIGGSPCQGFSFAGKQLNFNDPRSKLFFEFVRLKNECKPKYFFLENVKMKKEYQKVISDLLGVEPIEINSALVSAQNRKRLYWTNIPFSGMPEDRGIMLKDILIEGVTERDKSYCIEACYYKGGNYKQYIEKGRRQLVFELEALKVPIDKSFKLLDKEVERGKAGHSNSGGQGDRVYYLHGKSVTLSAEGGGRGAKTGLYLFGCLTPDRIEKRQNGQRFSIGDKFYTLTAQDKHGVLTDGYIRKLHPVECERLQTFPDTWTEGVSNSQRYKMLGNSWTVDVVAHFFRGLL